MPIEQFGLHLGCSVPQDPITLWPVRSLWALFDLSEASGHPLASQKHQRGGFLTVFCWPLRTRPDSEQILSGTGATPATTIDSNETTAKSATVIARSVITLLFH